MNGAVLPDDREIVQLPLDSPVDVHMIKTWPTATVKCSVLFPCGLVRTKTFPAAATLADVRDLIGRDHSAPFDHFWLSLERRAQSTTSSGGLDRTTLQRPLFRAQPEFLETSLFADSVYLNSLEIEFSDEKPLSAAARGKLKERTLPIHNICFLDQVFDLRLRVSRVLSEGGPTVVL
jgi:hypothetical protein